MFVIETDQVTKMRENSAIEPYIFVKVNKFFCYYSTLVVPFQHFACIADVLNASLPCKVAFLPTEFGSCLVPFRLIFSRQIDKM